MTAVKIEERQSTHIYRQKRMFTKEELEAREGLCVHEQPPYCNAACPLKLDVKAMAAAVAAGDFDRALALYEKITPFPHILALGCEAPCEKNCKLQELGEGIAIRELERSALAYGSKPRGGSLLRKKQQNAAVFGADLFSLFLAGELVKKRYPVSFYCAQGDCLSLVKDCAPGLPEEAAEATARLLSELDIDFKWGCEPEAAYWEEREKYALIAAAWDTARQLYPGLETDEAVMVCREHGLITGSTGGVLDSAFGAKRAALSADRIAQHIGTDLCAESGQLLAKHRRGLHLIAGWTAGTHEFFKKTETVLVHHSASAIQLRPAAAPGSTGQWKKSATK